ncbi:MAG: hypothetical protein U5L00_09890 [Desulfovermiculus sp.]|nr:hypothetical protein [Desulfovermiculus sp.]
MPYLTRLPFDQIMEQVQVLGSVNIMDDLSSAVAMKVNLDLQLNLMSSSLYHLLGQDVGRGYEVAKSRHIIIAVLIRKTHTETLAIAN